MSENISDIIISLGVIGLVMMVPIVAMFTKHQQKMAEIYRGGLQNNQNDERVLREIAELRQLVVQQSLAIENLKRDQALPPPAESVQNRLGV